jgi:hypothetical protein
MTKSIGLSETPGEPTGVKMVSSVFAEEQTTLALKLTALGLLLKTLGPKRNFTRLLKLKRMILITILPYIHSHSQHIVEKPMIT